MLLTDDYLHERYACMRTSIGQHLRYLRTHAGLRQTQLAQQLGIVQSAVSEIEADKRDVSITLVKRWFSACNSTKEQAQLVLQDLTADLPAEARANVQAAA